MFMQQPLLSQGCICTLWLRKPCRLGRQSVVLWLIRRSDAISRTMCVGASRLCVLLLIGRLLPGSALAVNQKRHTWRLLRTHGFLDGQCIGAYLWPSHLP